MKRYVRSSLVKGILFLIIAGYLFVHLTYIFRPVTMEKLSFEGFYAEKPNSLDVVFIGTSGLRASIDPIYIYENTGITSYVLATSQQNPKVIPYLIEEVKKTQSPELYVIDLGGCKYEADRWENANEGSIRHISDGLKYSINYFICITQLCGIKDSFLYLFDLFYYHNEWDSDLLIYLLKNPSCWNYEVINDKKGHAIWQKLQYQDRVYYENDITERKYVWDEECINRIIEYCRKTDLNVVFFVSNENLTNYSDYLYLEKIIDEKSSYDLIYMNQYIDEMNLDYKYDFYDVGHLNVNGALKASKILAEILNEKIHVDNRVNEQWDSLIDIYDEDLNRALTCLQDYSNNYICYDIDGVYNNRRVNFTVNSNNDFDVEYAWYLEHTEESETIVDKVIWYNADKNNCIDVSDIEVGKNYQIRFFIRSVNQDKNEDKIVAYLNWDSELNDFVLITGFY